MNKSKLLLPLAGLLIAPFITGCGPNNVYQPSFNEDQIICTHGSQIVDITLESHVKSKLHFKDELDTKWFVMPEGYTSKEVEYACPYNNGSSAFILFSKDTQLPEGEDVVSLKITVKKEAFKEQAIDGELVVGLYPNQVQYAGYLADSFTEEGEQKTIYYNFEACVKLIGVDMMCTEDTWAAGGNGTCFTVTSSATVDAGSLKIWEMPDNNYFIQLRTVCSEQIDDNTTMTLRFKSGATTLSGYHCDYQMRGDSSKTAFLFEKD